MVIDRAQIEATSRRFVEREKERARNLRCIRERRYLDADRPDRVAKFLARHGFSRRDAENFLSKRSAATPVARETVAGRVEPFALERVLGTNDLMGVAFLERGLQVARSIGRIWMDVAHGRPHGFGTGFLVSPRLLLTNHHVLGDFAVAGRSLIEFDHQLGVDGNPLPTTTFALAPGEFHFADPHLDYALVAVLAETVAGRSLSSYGFNPLIEEEGKAIISQWVNIIQHPGGEPKQLCLRENQLVDLLDDFVHYRTDTAPGSSGAPVFNDRWEVVALHHSGVWATNAAGQPLAVDGRVWTADMGEHRIQWIANEGARISRVVAHLRRQTMTASQRRLFDEVFASVPPPERQTPPGTGRATTGGDVAAVVVDDDGTATWTIPVSVSIRVGGAAVTVGGGVKKSQDSPPVAPPSDTADGGKPPVPPIDDGDETAILAAAQAQWSGRSDVLGVRLGYVYENGWITRRRALVATVRRKLSPAALREANVPPLPETFRGLPVEVTDPTLGDLLRLARGVSPIEAALGDEAISRDEITYVPPPGVVFDPVTAPMRVVAHVSPDAGWAQLSSFLAAAKKTLVVGMYDFGAPHILEAVKTAGSKAAFNRLTLVMQRGESIGHGTKANDLEDAAVVDELRDALGAKFENAWVKIGTVNGWVASSYHIKVAVRDGKAFWLSSGNWQSSNQPDADPLGEDPQRRRWLNEYNREWHVIIEHEGLAKTYERLLKHDFANNPIAEPPEVLALPELFVPASLETLTALERQRPFEYFEPFDEEREFTVQPLLTPDNYHAAALQLVRSATDELLIQNQTFNAPGANHAQLRELVDAVLERQNAGIKVRIVFRLFRAADARENLDGLQDLGFDMNDVKVQKNCHTKGIIVDRRRVLIGSQNWSNHGVSVNRDASLLFDDPPLAEYFAQIFEHDWDNQADHDIGPGVDPIELAGAGPAPAGMVRLSWKDYLEMR
jgi:hypothetical protein